MPKPIYRVAIGLVLLLVFGISIYVDGPSLLLILTFIVLAAATGVTLYKLLQGTSRQQNETNNDYGYSSVFVISAAAFGLISLAKYFF